MNLRNCKKIKKMLTISYRKRCKKLLQRYLQHERKLTDADKEELKKLEKDIPMKDFH